MLTRYYKFEEQPFSMTPDSRCLYLGPEHREAAAALIACIRAERGFAALIAEPGMGKTTLLYAVMEQLRFCSRVIYLFQTKCSSIELLRYLMVELNLDPRDKSSIEMFAELQKALFDYTRDGRRFVLIIDEAQNLSIDVLETVRLLSNCETPHSKLLQVVFSGHPQLGENLNKPDLLQLRQRISTVAKLKALGPHEVKAYIQNRLDSAGYSGTGVLFTPSALSELIKQSNGVPRNINVICFNALSRGYMLKRMQVDAAIVREAVRGAEIGDFARIPASHGEYLSVFTKSRDRISSAIAHMKVPSRSWLFRAAVLMLLVFAGGFFPLAQSESHPSKRLVALGTPQSLDITPLPFEATVSPDKSVLLDTR